MTEPPNPSKDTSDTVHDHSTAIQRSLDLDDAVRQYGELLVSELTSHDLQIRFPARTAAASLLIACRIQETPVRVTEIADSSAATKTEILNEMQRISNALELGIPNDDPIKILEDACHELNLATDIETRAQQVAELGIEAGVTSGVSPFTYAAAVLYIASSAADTDLSQADIADQFDISTAILRDRRDDLLTATGSRLFELHFPTASSDAVSLVDDLLHHAETAHWAENKRSMGVLAGAWLYVANSYHIETSATELASVTGVSESTVRARYQDFVKHTGTSDSKNSA